MNVKKITQILMLKIFTWSLAQAVQYMFVYVDALHPSQ